MRFQVIAMSSRVFNRRRGFTLVELLVVIAIIALLIAILVPTLSRAQASSRFVKCASNIRQQLMAIHVYAAENRDHKPPLWTATGTTVRHDWVSPNTRWSGTKVGLGILVPRYLSFEVLLDPSEGMMEDVVIDRAAWEKDGPTDAGSSYAYRWRDRPWPLTTAFITTAMKRELPSGATVKRDNALKQRAVIMDVNAEPGHQYSGEYAGRAWTSHPVMKKLNVGFTDGHVASYPLAEVILKYPGGERDELNWFTAASAKAH